MYSHMNGAEEVVLVWWLKIRGENERVIIVSSWCWVVIGGGSRLKKEFSDIVVVNGGSWLVLEAGENS